MAEPWLSTVEKLTEFFATDQIETRARRTKFVQRTSKITGKLFLALVTFGRWSAPKTTVAQLAAKAAQLDVPVDFTPAALQQRMTARAVAFLREVLQTAFATLQWEKPLHLSRVWCEHARPMRAGKRGGTLREREQRVGINDRRLFQFTVHLLDELDHCRRTSDARPCVM